MSDALSPRVGEGQRDPATCQTAAVADHPTRDDIDLCSGTFWAGDHHESLTWMRENAPVYFDGNVWGVSRYADVREVSRLPEVFSNAVALNSLDARYWYFVGLCKAAQGRDAESDFRQGVERERRNLPHAGTIDASLERLSPDARQTINRARGRS